MTPPKEFVGLAQSFYPGSRKKDGTLEEQIATVVVWETDRQRQISKRYLIELLASKASDDDLKRIWDDTNPTYGFPRGIRHFLALLREAL